MNGLRRNDDAMKSAVGIITLQTAILMLHRCVACLSLIEPIHLWIDATAPFGEAQ